ncbi:MAG: hypothetical protein WAM58_06525 [Candidatus Acidiferrum sp.]
MEVLPVAIDVGPLAAPGGELGAAPPGDPEPDDGDPPVDPEPDGGAPPAEAVQGHGTGGAHEANQIPISGRPQL